MQKKIIALAIAAALTAPALAFADASVYGKADLSIDMVNDGATAGGTSTNQLTSNYSYIGFKGSQDLGNGLSIAGKIEGSVGMDGLNANGTSNNFAGTVLFNRDTYIALTSATMGTVLAGQAMSPYMASTRRLDVFNETVAADNRNSMGVTMMGAGHEAAYANNAIAYLSPNLNNFSFAVASVFGAETASNANPTKGSAYSLSGSYEQGPIYATVAYDTMKIGDPGTGTLGAGGPFAVNDTSTVYKVGGGYTLNQFLVSAVIERAKYDTALSGASDSGTNFYLAGKFNISGTDAVKAAYTSRGAMGNLSLKATEFALGYDHSLSKSTTVYALYAKVNQDNAGISTNASPSTASVGINYAF